MFAIGDFEAFEKKSLSQNLHHHILSFLGDESGATMVEYGLMVALLTVIMISTLTSMGDNLAGTFEEADTGFK